MIKRKTPLQAQSSKLKRNNRTKRLVFNQLTYFILGLLVLILLLFPLSKKMTKRYKLNQEIEDLNQEIVRLEGRNSDFKKVITYLESSEFAEEEARMNLNLKKEGEEVLVIKTKDEGSLAKDTNISKRETRKSLGNPANWWSYFLK